MRERVRMIGLSAREGESKEKVSSTCVVLVTYFSCE